MYIKRVAAVLCSSVPYRLGGVGLVLGSMCKLGRAWMLHGWCMVVVQGVMHGS